MQNKVKYISFYRYSFFLLLKMASADATAIAKEIKTQLKQARELINQKDHSGALKICEVISSHFDL
jgi:hypothetical protein